MLISRLLCFSISFFLSTPVTHEKDPESVSPTFVSIEPRHGKLLDTPKGLVLSFSFNIHNRLNVGIDQIEWGILFAENSETLEEVDPSKLYQTIPYGSPQVGVIRRKQAIQVSAQQSSNFDIEVPLKSLNPHPHVFRSHVLSYRLAEVSAEILFHLLASDSAADEVAAVTTLALLGDDMEKAAVRQRWLNERELLNALVSEIRAPPKKIMGHAHALRKVFAIRALGILGQAQEKQLLADLTQQTNWNRYDEALQVLRVARFVGSKLETPLAFAVPLEARRMQDVMNAALSDLDKMEHMQQHVKTNSVMSLGTTFEEIGSNVRSQSLANPVPNTQETTLFTGLLSSRNFVFVFLLLVVIGIWIRVRQRLQ